MATVRYPASEWLNADCRPFGLPASAMESTYLVDRAAEFFEHQKDRARAAPFAMVLGFPEPHSPFKFPEEWAGRYRPDDFTAPAVSELDRLEPGSSPG